MSFPTDHLSIKVMIITIDIFHTNHCQVNISYWLIQSHLCPRRTTSLFFRLEHWQTLESSFFLTKALSNWFSIVPSPQTRRTLSKPTSSANDQSEGKGLDGQCTRHMRLTNRLDKLHRVTLLSVEKPWARPTDLTNLHFGHLIEANRNQIKWYWSRHNYRNNR